MSTFPEGSREDLDQKMFANSIALSICRAGGGQRRGNEHEEIRKNHTQGQPQALTLTTRLLFSHIGASQSEEQQNHYHHTTNNLLLHKAPANPEKTITNTIVQRTIRAFVLIPPTKSHEHVDAPVSVSTFWCALSRHLCTTRRVFLASSHSTCRPGSICLQKKHVIGNARGSSNCSLQHPSKNVCPQPP